MLEVGTVIGGKLRIERIIGAGGMGVVAAATHLELEQPVAIKVLRDELADRADIVERFVREARAVAKLRTEHVCRVSDVGRLDSGAPYIVMEMLEGSDLQSAITHQPLSVGTAADYIIQACTAIAEAHAAGIIHRDLKPANLFVTRRPNGTRLVKVLDFGIAKALATIDTQLTNTETMIGSPAYMSPEQLHDARDVDGRSDIWALGVTLYQLVTGRLPFTGTSATGIAIKIATADPTPLDGPLNAIVMKCLAKERDARYRDVAALVADLQPLVATPVFAMAATVASTVNETRAKRPVLAIAAVILLAAGGGAFAWWRVSQHAVAVVPRDAKPDGYYDFSEYQLKPDAPRAVDAHEFTQDELLGAIGALDDVSRDAIKQADKLLAKSPGAGAALRMGASAACSLGDAAKAQSYYDQMTMVDKATVLDECNRTHTKLVVRH